MRIDMILSRWGSTVASSPPSPLLNLIRTSDHVLHKCAEDWGLRIRCAAKICWIHRLRHRSHPFMLYGLGEHALLQKGQARFIIHDISRRPNTPIAWMCRTNASSASCSHPQDKYNLGFSIASLSLSLSLFLFLFLYIYSFSNIPCAEKYPHLATWLLLPVFWSKIQHPPLATLGGVYTFRS
jgi:hypothetical protein